MFPEPHSTKEIEDCVAWGLDTTPETLGATSAASRASRDREEAEALCRAVRCPVLVVHGHRGRDRPAERGARVAELTGGELVLLEGSGHAPHARDPVAGEPPAARAVDGARPPARPARVDARAARGRKRALFVSSPIGLGHAWRDVRDRRRAAPARARPGDRLARPGAGDAVLEARGETIHPASARAGLRVRRTSTRERGEHDLHAFQAIRRMDEILLRELHAVRRRRARATRYDLWIGDEAWELDDFLHENPELKTRAVRVADRLRRLAADARRRRARGGPVRRLQRRDDRARRALPARARRRAVRRRRRRTSSPDASGPGCRRSATWTERHSTSPGYVTGFDPRPRRPRRAARRARLRRTTSCASSPSAAPGRRRAAAARAAALPARAGASRGCAWSPWRARGSIRGLLPDADGLEVRGYVHEACTPRRRLRRRARPGRPGDDDGARRRRPPVRLRPARRPLRAAGPRAPPARPPRRAGVAAVGAGDAGRARRRGRRGVDGPVRATGRCPTPAWRGRRTRSPGCWSPPSGGRTAP